MSSVDAILVNDEIRLSQEGLRLRDLDEFKLAKNSVVPSIKLFGLNFVNLKILWISWSGLCDLSGICGVKRGSLFDGGLPNLVELYASYNKVKDLSPLKGHRCLQVIDLEFNDLGADCNLSSLMYVPNLEYLVLRGNSFTQNAEDYNIPKLKQLIPKLQFLDDIDVTAIKGFAGNPLRAIRARKNLCDEQQSEMYI